MQAKKQLHLHHHPFLLAAEQKMHHPFHPVVKKQHPQHHPFLPVAYPVAKKQLLLLEAKHRLLQ